MIHFFKDFPRCSNSTWFPVKSSTLPTCKPTTSRDDDAANKKNDTDNNLKETTNLNPASSLENRTLARIMADEEYDEILELVCDDIPHTLYNN